MERGGMPDVYQYNNIPNALRVQIVHIWGSAIGAPEPWNGGCRLFDEIHSTLCREYGVFDLTGRRESQMDKVANFMLEAKESEHVLDVIVRWIPKVGLVGSLTQSQNHDPYVKETTSA